MGWGDPDTLLIAMAEGAARRQNIAPGTLEWMKAFRAAYNPEAADGNEYLKALDEQIQAVVDGGPVPGSDIFVLGISHANREDACRIFGGKSF